MALQLPSKMADLLGEVVRKRHPDLIGVLGSPKKLQLTESQREELRQVITDEFAETGLRDDDEPNSRGLLLEDLIDWLGRV